jgi:hypothetical protein
MGPKDLFDMIEELIGHRCRIETTDGTIRYETIHAHGGKHIKWPGTSSGEVYLPTVLYYDERKAEGVELAILHSIEIDEPKGVGVR